MNDATPTPYEVHELIPQSGFRYKIRTAYSGFISSALKAALIDAARAHMTRELGSAGSSSILIDEDRAWQYAMMGVTYMAIPEGETVSKLYFRTFIPEYLFRAIVSVLVTPLAKAPDPLSIVEELPEEAVSMITGFFTSSFEKPMPSGMPSPRSTNDSPSNGQEEKPASKSNSTEASEAENGSTTISQKNTGTTSAISTPPPGSESSES